MNGDKVDSNINSIPAVSLFRGIYNRVAKRLGVDPSYVSRVARGERKSAVVEKALAEEVRIIREHLNNHPESNKDGYKGGYSDGHKDGYKDGHSDGHKDGHALLNQKKKSKIKSHPGDTLEV